MKKSPKKKSRSAAKSVSTLLPVSPLAPVSRVLGGMIATLEELLGEFERPINAELKELIKLTKALRDEGCAPPRKKRK